jgi:predicted membrane GTPase involved in stress response
MTINAEIFAINQVKKGEIVSVSGYLYIFISSGIAQSQSAKTLNIMASNGLSVICHNIMAKRAKDKQV